MIDAITQFLHGDRLKIMVQVDRPLRPAHDDLPLQIARPGPQIEQRGAKAGELGVRGDRQLELAPQPRKGILRPVVADPAIGSAVFGEEEQTIVPLDGSRTHVAAQQGDHVLRQMADTANLPLLSSPVVDQAAVQIDDLDRKIRDVGVGESTTDAKGDPAFDGVIGRVEQARNGIDCQALCLVEPIAADFGFRRTLEQRAGTPLVDVFHLDGPVEQSADSGHDAVAGDGLGSDELPHVRGEDARVITVREWGGPARMRPEVVELGGVVVERPGAHRLGLAVQDAQLALGQELAEDVAVVASRDDLDGGPALVDGFALDLPVLADVAKRDAAGADESGFTLVPDAPSVPARRESFWPGVLRTSPFGMLVHYGVALWPLTDTSATLGITESESRSVCPAPTGFLFARIESRFNPQNLAQIPENTYGYEDFRPALCGSEICLNLADKTHTEPAAHYGPQCAGGCANA